MTTGEIDNKTLMFSKFSNLKTKKNINNLELGGKIRVGLKELSLLFIYE